MSGAPARSDEGGAFATVLDGLEAAAAASPPLLPAAVVAAVPGLPTGALAWVEPSLGLAPAGTAGAAGATVSLESGRVLGASHPAVLVVESAGEDGLALHAVSADAPGVRVAAGTGADAHRVRVVLDGVALPPPFASGARAEVLVSRLGCTIAAGAVALGARALELAEALAEGAAPGADRQADDFRRADMCVRVDAARLLVLEAADRLSSGAPDGGVLVLESLLVAMSAATDATFLGILSAGAPPAQRIGDATALHLEACLLRALFAPDDAVRAALSKRLLETHR